MMNYKWDCFPPSCSVVNNCFACSNEMVFFRGQGKKESLDSQVEQAPHAGSEKLSSNVKN